MAKKKKAVPRKVSEAGRMLKTSKSKSVKKKSARVLEKQGEKLRKK